MIEIRNDEIGDEAGQRRWAGLIASILSGINPASGEDRITDNGSTAVRSRRN